MARSARDKTDRNFDREEGEETSREDKRRKKQKKRDTRVFRKANSEPQECPSPAQIEPDRIRNIIIIEQPTEESLRLSPTRRSPSSRNIERRPSSLDINELGKFLKISQTQFRSLTPSIAKRMDKENKKKVEANSLERIEFNKKVHESSSNVRDLQQSYTDMKSYINTTIRDNEQKFRNVDKYIREISEIRDRKLNARKSKHKRDTLTNSFAMSSGFSGTPRMTGEWKDTFGKVSGSLKVPKSDNEKESCSSESELPTSKKLKSTVSDNPSESTFKQRRKKSVTHKF